MQAQFGKEVLGSVRLEEARKHKDKAETIRRAITSDTDIETKRLLKAQAKDESRLYSKIKNARWTVLARHSSFLLYPYLVIMHIFKLSVLVNLHRKYLSLFNINSLRFDFATLRLRFAIIRKSTAFSTHAFLQHFSYIYTQINMIKL